MDRPHEPAGVPAFSPQGLMDLFLRGRHDELSETFLAILRHFRGTSYAALDGQGQRFVNEFVKHFLYFFTQAEYVPGPAHQVEFVRHNLTVSNLVAVSTFGTTDAFLPLVAGQPAGLAKTLALLSARNAAVPDRAGYFAADPALASVWFGAYTESYRSGLVLERVGRNLADHFARAGDDDRLDVTRFSLDAYYASSYVAGDGDRAVKACLNRLVRGLAAARNVRVVNRPDPRKVAVLSGNWHPAHSVYRITRGFVEALKGRYHLTFFQLGSRAGADTSLFDEVHRIDFDASGVLDLGPLPANDFAAAYFPDVGMTPHSILLANLRLAPVQVCSPGHSVSTFGAEVDYFVSGVEAEPPDRPERNYSERLVLLPGSGAVHERPAYRPTGRRRGSAEFVLNGPWNAQKVNARFARLLGAVVRGAGRPLRLRVFASASLSRNNDYLPFARDLEAALGPCALEVHPGLPYADYMALMGEGDLTLDSYHFGGCNTVADSLHLRRLVVAREGDRWYNRIGPQMLRAAGLPELIAAGDEEYVALARALIRDDALRAGLQERLDRADLDATVFDRGAAWYFPEAITYLVANHERLRDSPDRAPIRIGC